jgi:large subunit ribosomal protein L7/L12
MGIPLTTPSGGSSPSPGKGAAGKGSSKQEEPTKKEEKKEKEAYDIELTSFDPAKKIVLIKEVKNLLNLGLKDAKDLVEKAPTIIMKAVKKDKTEEILNKLKDNGGHLKLL